MPSQPNPPTIGYLCPHLIGDFYQTQWMALHSQAQSHGAKLLIFSPYIHYIKHDMAERYRRSFYQAHAAKLDGVLINAASLEVFFDQAEINDLFAGFGGIPLITLSAATGVFQAVIADNGSGLRSLMAHLLEDHGYRRLAFVKGIEGNAEASIRLGIFRESLSNHGLAVDESLIFPGNFGSAAGDSAVATLCEHPDLLPDVIVCANDEMAIGAIEGLIKRGLRVPEDIAVTGYDDIESASRFSPPLTTVTQEVVTQLESAVDRLMAAMQARPRIPTADPAVRLVPTRSTIRESCGCPGNPGGPAFSRDNLFLQESQYLINNRGCEIGEIANFSKNIMESLSFENLRDELAKLAKVLNLETLQGFLYDPESLPSPEGDGIPETSQMLFDLSPGFVATDQAKLATRQVLAHPGGHPGSPHTLVISELVFGHKQYGYLVVGRRNPEPLIFQMINLELSNCLYTIYQKNRMDAANQKLRAFDSLKNDFIANITHDFRSPLSIILGTSELALLETPLEPEHAERYQVIRDASYKLKDIIDRFLDLSRMDERGVMLRIQNMDLVSYLTAFGDFYGSSLLKSSVSFELELPPQAPSGFWSDPEKLDQILSNLVSNALKFIDPVKGSIRLRLHDQPNQVVIEVADNGIGIPVAKLETVFERFTQLGDGRNQRFRGTGIGLAFSRTLATHLKGNLSARSAGPGLGATFILTLPKGKAHFSENEVVIGEGMSRELPYDRQKMREQAAVQVQEFLPRALELQLPPEGQRIRDFSRTDEALILIIEDNPAILKLERDCLARVGYQYFILAGNGSQGLAAARQYRPDLIICDINLPGIPGDQLYRTLIEDDAFSRTPFVFVSAVADRDFIRQLRDRGAEAFLTKPLDTEELVLTVNLHVRSSFERQQEIQQAQKDELTGLANRNSLQQQVQALFLCRRYRDFSFIFLDVDHFKAINDTYGHHAGDLVLHAIAQCLQANLRPYDLIGRHGGEEFLILLPDTALRDAEIVAEKLRVHIAELRIPVVATGLYVTASFGLSSLRDQVHLLPQARSAPEWPAVFQPDPSRVLDWKQWEMDINGAIEHLIRRADQGMYLAKQGGRNRLGVFAGPLT